MTQLDEAFNNDPSFGDERQLVLAYQRGEEELYSEIHGRYEQRVAGVCYRILGRHGDAEEATQETFLRVHQALPRFNGRYQLGAWITRIATNVCLDMLRSRSRRPVHPVDEEVLKLEPLDDFESNPETLALRSSEGRRVRRVLAKLPPMHRAALVLRDFEGLSYAEVATALQITECQVKALIHRARQRFKKSWLSGVTAILPWRFMQRLRGVEVVSRDGAINMAGGSAPAVMSCSSALQQCGQYVTDHVATAIATVLVGATLAGGGAGAIASKADVARSAEGVSVAHAARIVERSEDVADARTRGSIRHSSTFLADKDAPPVSEGEEQAPTTDDTATKAEGEAPETVTPDPTPEPSPTPPSKDSTSSKSEGDGGAAPLSIGWVTTQQPSPGTSSAEGGTTSFSCAAREFEQSLSTTASFEGRSLPMSLQLFAGASGTRLEFALYVTDRWVRYSSWGASPIANWADERLEITGRYGPLAGHDTMSGPGEGSFRAALSLDCSSSTVVTESLTFTTG